MDLMSKLNAYIQFDDEYEDRIYIPNEIFNDLVKSGIKGSKHIAFAYSYYWLISWLYRYTKYGQCVMTVDTIKDILGVLSNGKRLDYIIKKNGILDEMGYTMSDTDYPIGWTFADRYIEFEYFSDMHKDDQHIMRKCRGKNYKIKVPIKGLWRTVESMNEGYYDGTFYEVSNTHVMRVSVFEKCMDTECGLIGFYIYGFLKDKCQKHGEYKSSYERIAEDTGLSKNTVIRYLDKLIECGLIECKVSNGEKTEDGFHKEPNTYRIV